jgi:hypothetical protein
MVCSGTALALCYVVLSKKHYSVFYKTIYQFWKRTDRKCRQFHVLIGMSQIFKFHFQLEKKQKNPACIVKSVMSLFLSDEQCNTFKNPTMHKMFFGLHFVNSYIHQFS